MNYTARLFLAVFAVCYNVPVFAQDSPATTAVASTSVEKVRLFFVNHLEDKAFARPATVEYYDNDTVKSEAQTTFKFEGLKASESKLHFDHRSIYKQRITKVNRDKQSNGEPEIKDRNFVNRIFLSKRKSTGELLGFSYSRLPDGTPKGDGYEMWTRIVSVTDDNLVMKQGIMLYDDLYSGKSDQDWRPGAYEILYRFIVGPDGKVTIEVTDDELLMHEKTLKQTGERKRLEQHVYTEVSNPEDNANHVK